MTIALLINRYCARCETKLNDDEVITCAECTTVVGPRIEGYTIVCFICGDAWGHDRTKVCDKCLDDIEMENRQPV